MIGGYRRPTNTDVTPTCHLHVVFATVKPVTRKEMGARAQAKTKAPAKTPTSTSDALVSSTSSSITDEKTVVPDFVPTESIIRTLLSPYGTLTRVLLPSSASSVPSSNGHGSDRPFAMVSFSSPSEALAAQRALHSKQLPSVRKFIWLISFIFCSIQGADI
jgi:hypothetical protein